MIELWDILDENGNKTGRLHERGKLMGEGEYHLVVYVWIMNSNGEFLIAKRTPNKYFPNMWECIGGNAVAGDDGLTTALKEVHEEIGIILEPKNGQLFKHYKYRNNNLGSFVDVWLFTQEFDISDVVLCPNETCDAMWASCAEIKHMVSEGTFIEWDNLICMDELFEFCANIPKK